MGVGDWSREMVKNLTKASQQALFDLMHLTGPKRNLRTEQHARDELHVIVCRLNRICARACRLSPSIRKSVVWTCDGAVLLEPQDDQRLLKTIDAVSSERSFSMSDFWSRYAGCEDDVRVDEDDVRVAAKVLDCGGCAVGFSGGLHRELMHQFMNQYRIWFADYEAVFMKCVRDRASARGWTIKDDGRGGFCCRLFEKTLKREPASAEAPTETRIAVDHRGKKRVYNPCGTLCAEFSAFRGDENWIKPGDRLFEPYPDHPWPTCYVPRFNVRVGLRVDEPGGSRFDALCWKIGGFGSFVRDEIVVVEASDADNASLVSPGPAMDFGPDTRVFFADAEEVTEVQAGLEAAVTASLELHQEAKQIITEKYKGEQEKSDFFDKLSFTFQTAPGCTPGEKCMFHGPSGELREDHGTELVLFLDDDAERARHIEEGETLFHQLDHIIRADYRAYHEDTTPSSDRDPAVREGERGASGPPLDGAEKSNDEILHLRIRVGIRQKEPEGAPPAQQRRIA